MKRVQGKPNRDAIKQVQENIYENAASMLCELGGGQHGCLGLTMTNARCNAITGKYFHEESNLGPVPVIPEQATQYEIAESQTPA